MIVDTSAIVAILKDEPEGIAFSKALDSREQARIAWQAYRDYGRGSGHAANLNDGDCFSYALARGMREPILFKGDDVLHANLRSAVARSLAESTNCPGGEQSPKQKAENAPYDTAGLFADIDSFRVVGRGLRKKVVACAQAQKASPKPRGTARAIGSWNASNRADYRACFRPSVNAAESLPKLKELLAIGMPNEMPGRGLINQCLLMAATTPHSISVTIVSS